MGSRMSRMAGVAVAALLVYAQTPSAGAVHLFPTFEGDPGGDCAAELAPDPGDADANMTVEGFFFVDESDGDSTIEIEAGEKITWEWIQYCHSVTSTSVPEGAEEFTTFGGEGSATGPPEGEDELVKPEGEDTTFSRAFEVAGTYEFQCVHHASVGMTGTIVVSETAEDEEGGEDDTGGEGPADDGTGGDGAGSTGATDQLPATGAGSGTPGSVLMALGLAGLALGRRRP